MKNYPKSLAALPPEFFQIPYNARQIPGGASLDDLSGGANCQVLAYAILRYFGYELPPFRSSELWADTEYTRIVEPPFEPLDIMLYHRHQEAFGAHVGLYWGEGKVLHLSKGNGLPAIEEHADLLQQEKYRCFIGAKRLVGN
ncbi:MAG: hydrolase [Bacteroidota bacterium]